MAQLGSFGASLPDGGEAIRQALSRRQQGGNVPMLSQVSASSPASQGMPMVTPGVSGSQGVPMPSGGQSTGALPSTGMPVGNPEAEIILKAMSDRLKTLGKVETGGI